MTDKFKDKSASVIVIDSSGPSRQLLGECVKGFGFTKVQGLATVKDALEQLEVEPCDWIITSLNSDQPENAMSLLKLCTMHTELRGTHVSFLLTDAEKVCLPAAFALGLVSWHRKPFTKDSLTQDLGDLLKLFEAKNWNLTLVASDFLRKILQGAENKSDWVEFEKSLLDLYPGTPDLLMFLAEALFAAGNGPAAQMTLQQAVLLQPSLDDAAKKLKAKHPQSGATGAETQAINVLGITNAVIVDSDEAIKNSVKSTLKEIGLDKVEAFDDGPTAAAWIKANPNPGLIIQEWRIPKMPGPLFLQRVIAEGAVSTPVVVLSSLIKKDDMPLLKEMGVAALIEKPFDKTEFLNTIIRTIQQERLPNEDSSMERKIRNLIKTKNKTDLDPLYAQFIAKESIPEAKRKLIEAEYNFFLGDYIKARDLCIESIRQAGDSVLSLNLLGKTLMALQDFAAALKCLTKAQTQSPLNIERLCSIAEANTELGKEKEAKAALEQAQDIDGDNVKVKETEVNLALANGETDKAQSLMHQLDSLDGIVSHMNNKAVALSRCGMVPEGIEEYRKALSALPKDQIEIRAKVSYNLALAYVRASELDDAKRQLEEVIQNPSKVKGKALSLKKRIEQALEKGTDFQLIAAAKPAPVVTKEASAPTAAEGEAPAPEADGPEKTENELLVAPLLAQRGEMGCYLIHKLPKTIDELSSKMLTTIPRYRRRKAIEREASSPTKKAG